MTDPERALQTVTGDGTISILLEPPGPETRAVIKTPDGEFGGRDYRVCITDLDAGANPSPDQTTSRRMSKRAATRPSHESVQP